jgi:thermitase
MREPKRLIPLAAAALMACASFAKSPEYVPGDVVVKFHPAYAAMAANVAREDGYRLFDRNTVLDFHAYKIPAGMTVEQAVQNFRSLPWVEYAEPNYIYRTMFTPNDTNWNSQWGPQKIQCPAAWDLGQGSPSVVIAIVDTGIDKNHLDLNSKFVPGRDFVNNDNDPDDDNGHGTHCAGIAAAVTNNSRGIAGVGFNSRLMGVKVLDAGGSGSLTNVANGIQWASDNGANVISLSLGSSGGATTLQNAVNYAWNAGRVVVAAAGNAGNTSANYPAFYTNCIAVASTTSSDTRSSFSTYGSWVDVAAPGSNIYSTYDGNTYATLSGTSMACPHVAGLAGLLFAKFPGSSATVIRQKIEQNCDPVGTFVAFGRVNAFKAMNSGGGGGGGTVLELAPTAGYRYGGRQISGSYANLAVSDNSYWTLGTNFGLLEMGVEWSGFAAGGTINEVTFTLELSSVIATNATVQAFNWQTNNWETIGTAATNSTDQTFTFTINSNPARFLEQSWNFANLQVVAPGAFNLSADFARLTIRKP